MDARPAPKPYTPDARLSLVAEWDGRVRIADTAPTPGEPQPGLLRGASAHDTLRLEQAAQPATQPARDLALLLAEHLPVLADQATPTALTIGIFHQSYAPKSPWKFATPPTACRSFRATRTPPSTQNTVASMIALGGARELMDGDTMALRFSGLTRTEAPMAHGAPRSAAPTCPPSRSASPRFAPAGRGGARARPLHQHQRLHARRARPA